MTVFQPAAEVHDFLAASQPDAEVHKSLTVFQPVADGFDIRLDSRRHTVQVAVLVAVSCPVRNHCADCTADHSPHPMIAAHSYRTAPGTDFQSHSAWERLAALGRSRLVLEART